MKIIVVRVQMRCVICKILFKKVPFWGVRMNNAMKDFWRVCYFKTNKEEWFTVTPKNSFDQQLAMGRWDPGDVDFKFTELVV